ncbi:MAG: extracellular solute-binding protein [Candidatus Limivivens sp.]|nr:extracellular solute-binding protein [Candidatus Limivivens sp.]
MKLKKILACAAASATVLTSVTGMVGHCEEEVTITMMFSGTATENDFETEQLPKLIKEAYPNVNLEVTKLPDNQYLTSLKTKLASGECPDIILCWPAMSGTGAVMELAKAGYLEPLSDLNCMELIGPSGRDPFTYEGEVYGIANGITVLGTYYNKNVFEENGISVPQTWSEFLECCQTLQEAGIQPIVMGDKDMYEMQFGLYQIAASQIYPSNPEYDKQLWTGETMFTDEGTWDDVMSKYLSLYENGYISDNSLGLGVQQAIQKFVDGEAAMIFDGSFNYSAIAAQGGSDFERGYFPLPGNDSGDVYVSASMGAGPAVYSGSENIEICKQILDLWFDGESDVWKAFVESGKIIPTYGYGVDQVAEIFQPFLELYNAGKAYHWCNQQWPGGTENEMEALLSEAIGGQGMDAAGIVEGMQMKFDELTGK